MRLSDSSLTLTGTGLPLMQFGLDGSTPATQPGIGLIARGSTITTDGAVLATGQGFIPLGANPTRTGASSQALVQLTDSSLRASTLLMSHGGTVDLVGAPLLSAANSHLTFDSAVVDSGVGGHIQSGTTAPLLALNGGTLTSNGHLFVVSGELLDAASDLVAPLRTAGVLLEATNGAAVDVAGNALRLDTALLQATMPILHLVGTPDQQAMLRTGGSTLDLFKSRVVGVGPIVALDRGLISVTDGPLLRLTDGSTMVVNGDLLQLLNGSKINVVNGPLISVSGRGSLLDVTGALVSFGGTGGNEIVVNNRSAPTAEMRQIPISTTTGGSITIGPRPITNPHLGSITVSPGGSAIQATDGGGVTIAAPGDPTSVGSRLERDLRSLPQPVPRR
jgi:hypothetical protein